MTLSRPFAAGSASPYPPSHSTHDAFSHTGLSNARRLTSSQLFYGKKSLKEKRTWVTAVDRPQQDMCVFKYPKHEWPRQACVGYAHIPPAKDKPDRRPFSAGGEPGRAATHPGQASSPACVASAQLPTSAGPQSSSVKWGGGRGGVQG